MKISTLVRIILATSLSLVISCYIYFGFTPNYSKDIFSPQSFKNQYDNNIYKYRILGKYLLLKIDDYLEMIETKSEVEPRILALDTKGTNHFYYAYVILNTFFFVLTAILLALMVESDAYFEIAEKEKNIILFLILFVIALSQFVITPYDSLGYFLQVLIFFIYTKMRAKYFVLQSILTAFLLILSTLNRESSALSLALLVLLAYLEFGFSKKFVAFATFQSLSFLIPYIALRLLIDKSQFVVVEGIQPSYNLTHIASGIGILFSLLFLYLPYSMANYKENKSIISLYHIFCLPYIIVCFTSGLLFEIRLYIPIFLATIFLSKINKTPFHIPILKLLK